MCEALEFSFDESICKNMHIVYHVVGTNQSTLTFQIQKDLYRS